MNIELVGNLFMFAGGIGMFLYGMNIMADGMQKSAGNMMTYRLWLPQGRQACQDNLRSAKLRRQCWLLVWAAWSHAGRVGEIYGGI